MTLTTKEFTHIVAHGTSSFNEYNELMTMKEKAEKWDNLPTLRHEQAEENKRLKEFVERVHRFREEYEDVVRERQRDQNYQGWCNESIRLDMVNEILQSERLTTKEGDC